MIIIRPSVEITPIDGSGSCSTSIWCDPCEGYRSVYAKLKKADVAPVVQGRWEKAENLKPKCSVCGEYHLYAWADFKKCNYCPNCGARMDGE